MSHLPATTPTFTTPALDILDAELVEHRSPLDCDDRGDYPTRLRGGVVTDPAEIAAIRKRVQASAAGRGAWRRVAARIRRGR